MLSDTLKEGLDAYRIGSKLRDLRTAKGLGLAQLGDHTGLSAGMLSKIERGSVFPTLPTLLRIAMVFGVGLEYFFDSGDKPVLEIVRRVDRIRLPNVTEGAPSYFFESLDFPVNNRRTEAFLATFEPGAERTAPHKHRQDEFIYVIEGTLSLQVHGRTELLEAGDAIYFDAGYPHAYMARGDAPAQVLVVLTDR